jgi:hypothetical protein
MKNEKLRMRNEKGKAENRRISNVKFPMLKLNTDRGNCFWLYLYLRAACSV